jgi:hypothetical protein
MLITKKAGAVVEGSWQVGNLTPTPCKCHLFLLDRVGILRRA